MISAIILAAGESRRMGRPKALVEFSGKTFLETVIATFKNAGIDDIHLVLGHGSDTIIQALNLKPGHYVLNEEYTNGQFSSFQTGVRNLKAATTGTFLALVDQPQIGPAVIENVLKSFKGNPDKVIIPTFDRKRGHPPLFPKWLFAEILAMPVSGKANELIRKYRDHIFEIEADESILWNINTEYELQRVLSWKN